ncbi:MAG: hypothetical protein JNJ43_19250, partial [Anaerolineales bacterium]|nr:hypothetical protein [Anaerolineales bacterium]
NGLYVDTNGNATFANITANENNGGAYIFAVNNLTLATFVNVTFTGVNTFNNNTSGDGLNVNTDGAITISNITANANEYYGAYLDNLGNANGIKAITLSGTNMFNSNKDDGLYIEASGNVTLTRITANYNNDPGLDVSHGVYVYSSFGNILLTCGSMYNNEGYGYDLTVGFVGKTITL